MPPLQQTQEKGPR
jgi:hypothetical protein